jgi:hypothetical protein
MEGVSDQSNLLKEFCLNKDILRVQIQEEKIIYLLQQALQLLDPFNYVQFVDI